MPETANMSRVLFREWFPQIVYNHHQTGPVGTVLFAPPFRDPFNYNYDPLIPLGIDLVGAAMHGRFAAEGKPGATMRGGASYSTWFNGGLRTTSYFHNQIGILTETIGNPTPMEIPFVPQRQLPSGDLPYPIAAQTWHFRQSVEYSTTANRAILDLASRYRETFLFNIYQMGRNSIRRGSQDSWTITPRRIEAVQAAIAKDTKDRPESAARPARQAGGRSVPTADPRYLDVLRDPALRDPRGYVLPSDQPDFPTAVKFVNMLLASGVTAHRATAPFAAAGKSYPAGSLVIKTAQAFRPHVLDMFEPQDHPNDFQYPGGPPIPPYDSAGYTLAFQMGVRFDRILDGFDGPFERITSASIAPPAGIVASPSTGGTPAGYVFSHHVNDAFIVLNRLLKSGEDVYWIEDGGSAGAGGMFVSAGPATGPILAKAAAELGVSFTGLAARPAGPALQLRPARVALWDRYGGSMASGWVRWILEKFEFPFDVVYPQTLDAGDLASRYDVVVLVTDAVLQRERGGATDAPEPPAFPRAPSRDRVPPEYQAWLGELTDAKTGPSLRRFVEGGGTVIAIGGATPGIVRVFDLPVTDALVEKQAGGDRRLPREKFYVPGSVLRVAVNPSHPVAFGMPARADVFFDDSPAFALRPSAAGRGVQPIAWFDSATPLRSGWAWGQHCLDGAVAAIVAPVGKGHVLLFGPEIAQRAQAHGTFKLLFNGIHYATARPAAPGGTSAARF
jgi:hypothetical protein